MILFHLFKIDSDRKSEEHHLSICIQLRMTKHPSRKVMNFRHLLGCDTIVTYIFGGKIWGSDTNFRGKFWGQAPRPPNIEVHLVHPFDFKFDSILLPGFPDKNV